MTSIKKQGVGKLTEVIFLEHRHRVPDGEGGLQTEWQGGEVLWAHIEAVIPRGFSEEWQGDRPHFSARYRVWMRQEHVLPLIYRFRWRQKILMPLSAVTWMPGQEWQMVLTQQEETVDER